MLVCEVVLCTARECRKPADLRFSFEVISANRRGYVLQASSRTEMLGWMGSIQGEIENQLHKQPGRNSMLPGSPGGGGGGGGGASGLVCMDEDDDGMGMNEYAGELRALNPRCADCGAPQPEWASINLGLMVCLQCSGVHRSLGVHLTKVRSLTLDAWSTSVQRFMCAVGNARGNGVWEHPDGLAALPDGWRGAKPTAASARADREKWIRAKYGERVSAVLCCSCSWSCAPPTFSWHTAPATDAIHRSARCAAIRGADAHG